MKIIKQLALILVCSVLATGIFAQQETEKDLDEKLEKSFDALTKDQQEGVLLYAMEQAEMDAKKEFLQLIKKMPDAKKEQLLNFSDNYNREALRYFITKVRPARFNKPPATNKATTGADKPGISKENLSSESPKEPPVNVQKKPAVNIERPTEPKEMPDMTTMEFEETEFQFGTIEQGEKVSYVFKFKNTGDNPLTISHAKGSCGCTVPEWPKEAIAPGKSGEVKVTFNSRGKRGMQSKRVTIMANTQPPQTYIFVKGTVNGPSSQNN